MAAGCPVIGANKGGIPDIISDGINGCLYDPDEKDNGVQSLIEATKKILENEDKREIMRKEARNEAEKWDWNQATLQLQNYYSDYIFPHNKKYKWNIDNHDKFVIPKENTTVNISIENISLYKDIIERYENNSLEIKGNDLYINNKITDKYTFKMNYYWMVGDNRHNSADSRFWGFVPENHIVGKALFIWMSWDKNAKGVKKIRWRRLFSSVK